MKRLIRKTLSKAGWELTRFRPESSEWARLVRMLSVHSVDEVIDVGANTGQYAKNLRDAGYHGRIVSFEPLLEAHAQLCRAARNDPMWTVAERMAIGDSDGHAEIQVGRNSVFSSFLLPLDALRDADPDCGFVEKQFVPIARLDTVANRFIDRSRPFFVKVDVQGFESKVLDGALGLLNHDVGLQLELPLIDVYGGATLFQPFLERMRNLDFDLWSLIPGFADLKTGRLFEVDGVFFKRTTA
jgi:FkbM family methyltransferase